jgi:poly-gamma-glutamate biosynthesis protein PgsC/CapC
MDPQTVAIGLGLIVSLIFTEAFGLAAGGMIVPGYLALNMHAPLNIALTLAVAGVTFGIVRGISQFAIIYGRRRIALMVLVGFVLGHVVRGWMVPPDAASVASGVGLAFAMQVIGCIIPGLIALWYDRQGVFPTVGTVLSTSSIVWLSLVVLGMEVPA